MMSCKGPWSTPGKALACTWLSAWSLVVHVWLARGLQCQACRVAIRLVCFSLCAPPAGGLAEEAMGRSRGPERVFQACQRWRGENAWASSHTRRHCGEGQEMMRMLDGYGSDNNAAF